MEQEVEYEWKPLFCDTCQKIGHQCTREKQATAKVWQPVKEKEVNKLPEVSTPNNPIEQASSTWTEVNKNKRVKGKMVLPEPDNNEIITCKNVFEALGSRVEQGGSVPVP